MMFQYDAATAETNDIWSRLAAPVPQEAISWRKDGNTVARDGRFYARFVAYIEANTVRERLDSVVPGEWDLLLELLPTLPAGEGEDGPTCAFRARLQVRGVMREDVGMGRDYKQAATDAFKRAAVRFGIAHELYSYDVNWVEMDGDGRYAKPREDPAMAYERRHAQSEERAVGSSESKSALSPVSSTATPSSNDSPNGSESGPARRGSSVTRLRARPANGPDTPACPKCEGPMWDNRPTKRNPNAPDFRCKNRSCDAVIWPTRLVPVGERANSTDTPSSSSLSLGGAADADEAL
jgi:hypothetical protein